MTVARRLGGSATTQYYKKALKGVVAHHASLWAAEDCLVTLALEMLKQARERSRHAVDLWQEVLCKGEIIALVSARPSPRAGLEDGPVMMATRSLA